MLEENILHNFRCHVLSIGDNYPILVLERKKLSLTLHLFSQPPYLFFVPGVGLALVVICCGGKHVPNCVFGSVVRFPLG